MSEDAAARLDMLRRGLIVGALIAATSAIAGYLNLVPGGHDLLTVNSAEDAGLKRPMPLQVVADPAGGFRLYAGRKYVIFTR